MNIYVGNLPHSTNEDELKEVFEAFGQVAAANIIRDKFTGQSRGFGFVEMPSLSEAQSAIEELNGKDLKGRPLTVNEARPRSEGDGERRPGGGGGRPGGGGGRPGGGGGRPGGGGGRPGGGGGRPGGGRSGGGGRDGGSRSGGGGRW